MEVNFSGKGLYSLPDIPGGLTELRRGGTQLTFLPKYFNKNQTQIVNVNSHSFFIRHRK